MPLDYYAFQKTGITENAMGFREPHLAYLYEALDHNENGSVRKKWQKSLKVEMNPWQEKHYDFCKIPDAFSFVPDISAIQQMPWFSFLLQIPFKLRKPYLSKNEEAFYLLENPLRREKIFKTPMEAASGWKGALRAAMLQQLARWWTGLETLEKAERVNRKKFVSRRLQLIRLFGTERGFYEKDNRYLDKLGGKLQTCWFQRCLRFSMTDSGFIAGRLHFFPTFFQEVGLEVINPHDSKTGTGSEKGPILLECVPQKAEGVFTLLYVPVGSFDTNCRKEVARDLEFLADGIKAMLTQYGFGAKTGSGFGIAEERLNGEGRLTLKWDWPNKAIEEEGTTGPAPGLPRYLEAPNRLIEELHCPDNSLKEEAAYRQWLEDRGRTYNKEKKQLYSKAKAWWEREGGLLPEAASRDGEKGRPSQNQLPVATEVTFNTLENLRSQARKIADRLKEGGTV
ncbi:hypothetical protein [Desulforamulus ruminis]|uniref:Uncharacterized protein n=1 Tax=Desulforamulus ruminis (strain ATCC 23193 / DSM 2154 / NCIMB 8452 / DL) TaxID=696281 RepID=F6DMZ0_DESRL|nr:hypothetical protein [Desulforamulus ruminis]AEG59448.1 protein of unknown function DUF324 [Desulforamulus ruminis DSM 2154]